ncbi:hypothetical protein [Mycobacterium sp. 141]|uniref:DUF7937 domain-containing protein n=1 Tax=Mycobacterium sp. 141 TaxID=1120797 RepID=UPI000365FDEB|nr:hypothetical protein [Mycobacterium sp. 141]
MNDSQTTAAAHPSRTWDVGRDAVGGVALLIALFLPWNLSFGFGVAGSGAGVFIALLAVTVVSWAAIVVGLMSRDGTPDRIRLWLNVPYLLFVAVMVLWDVLITVLLGSGGQVPPGVGPGAWIGVAGALCLAQPVLASRSVDDKPFRSWFGAARILGVVAVAFGVQSFVFNMYWRVRAVGSADAVDADGAQHAGYLTAALVYGTLSLAVVVIAARWAIRNDHPSRLAVVGLGVATILTAFAVWVSDRGLNIVPVQGAVNNTASGIGFQGYLLWCAAAAIFGPITMRNAIARRGVEGVVLRTALRHCLLLIAVWCGGMIAVRFAYLGLALTSGQSLSISVTATMVTANLAAGTTALWLRTLLASGSANGIRIAVVSGALFLLMIVRIAVDISQSAQHITATFNVTLALLSLVVAVAVLWFPTARRSLETAAKAPKIVAPAH